MYIILKFDILTLRNVLKFLLKLKTIGRYAIRVTIIGHTISQTLNPIREHAECKIETYYTLKQYFCISHSLIWIVDLHEA